MMEKLLKRGEHIGKTGQQRSVVAVAARVRALMRGASVTADDSRVVIAGRGLLKRWLSDPALRFLSGDLK